MPAQANPAQNPAAGDTHPTITLKLFKSLHEGFGDSDDVRYTKRMDEYTAIRGSTMRYNRVHGAVDARWPGQIRMGLKVQKIAAVAHDLAPVFGTSWTDTNGIYPAIFYLVGKKIMKVLFGAATEVGTNSLGSSDATGGMFDDDGSGVPYLYACFGGIAASSAKIRRMNRAQTVTASSDVVAGLLLSLNGKAYRTLQPSSGTAVCQVSVCPYGGDRMTNSAWGTAYTVGRAGTDINVLTAVRNAPVAVKPEGVFAYNQGLDQWINYAKEWEGFPHLRNGFGAYFLGSSLVIPMGDGGAVIFDGNSVQPFDPGGLDATPNLHTTRDNFEAGATGAMRHWIIGATGCPSKLISPSGMTVYYKTSGGVFTDNSSALGDLDLTTAMTFSYASGDEIYIGWDRPFCAVHFDPGTANAVARTMSVSVGTGTSTFTSVGAADTGFRDFTSLNGAPLGQSGNIVLMVDPVATTGWVQNTVNGTTKYWMKISFSGALTASVTWLTCQIQPWYPSVDAANFPLDGLDKSGCFPHLLYGRNDSSAGPVWHDMFSLPEPDKISQIIFGSSGGSSLNHSRQLTLLGRFGVWTISVADNDRPGTEASPYLNNVGLIEGASIDVPDPGTNSVVRLKSIRINGHEFDPNKVQVFFYYAFDWGMPWSRFGARVLTPPVAMENNQRQIMGVRFRWALGFKQSAAQATLSTPTITDIEADFEIVPGVTYTNMPERAMQTQPRF